MKARILRPEEWNGQSALLQFVSPANAAAVVVEDAGEQVARLLVLRTTMFEGLWIDPTRRTTVGAGRALLRQAAALAKLWGDPWVFAACESGTESEPMRKVLQRLGGIAIPADWYVMSLGG